MVFDFDGVVVDSEPAHLAGFRRMLETVGISLTEEQYYADYLGFDDHDCFQAAFRDRGLPVTEERIAELTAEKTVFMQEFFAESVEALPGAVALIRAAAAAEIPLGVCSGALLEEIRIASRTVGILENFATIVAAEDVRRGKPDPEGYQIALRRLREITVRPLAAERTVVVEDSPAGIAAGKDAGMRVLAVTTSYPRDALGQADRIVASLAEVDPSSLEELL